VVDNESLEFLGDAVLGFVVADLLYREFPHFQEGQKSKAKAALVSTAALAELAQRIGLGAYLLLGRGEEKTGGRHKQALLADGCEAVIAAVYLDGGVEAARIAGVGQVIGWRCADVEGVTEWDAWLAAASPRFRRRRIDPDSVCMQPYTSGSTGKPKGVLLAHRGQIWNADIIRKMACLDDTERALVAVPLAAAADSAFTRLVGACP